jgi:hypothetical protein
MPSVTAESPESVAEFRARARAWLAANLPRLDSDDAMILERDGLASWQRPRIAKEVRRSKAEKGGQK